MQAYWGVEVQLHVFLISSLEGGEWSASRTGGPQNRSERCGEEKNSQPLPGLEPLINQPVAKRCKLS
jgi:hypothetical protein